MPTVPQVYENLSVVYRSQAGWKTEFPVTMASHCHDDMPEFGPPDAWVTEVLDFACTLLPQDRTGLSRVT